MNWEPRSTYRVAEFARIARLDEMDEDMDQMKHVVTIRDLQYSIHISFGYHSRGVEETS